MAHPTAYAAQSPPRARPLTGPAGIPVVAAVVTAAGAAVTGTLAEGALEHGDLAAHDPSVTDWFVHLRTPVLTAAAQVVTTVGSEVAIGALTALVLAWLVVSRRAWTAAVVVAGAMGTAAALTIGLKHLVARPRPLAAVVLGPLDHGYSFPSGHTLFTTVFLGLVAALLWAGTQRAVARAAIVLGWVCGSAAMGLSRVYLGYHWLTDVMASWTLALVVLTVSAAAWSLLRDHPVRAPRLRRSRLDDRSSHPAGS